MIKSCFPVWDRVNISLELSCCTKVNKVWRHLYWVAGKITSRSSCRVKTANSKIFYSYQLASSKWQGISFGCFSLVVDTTKLGASISSAYLNCLQEIELHAVCFYKDKTCSVPFLNVYTTLI